MTPGAGRGSRWRRDYGLLFTIEAAAALLSFLLAFALPGRAPSPVREEAVARTAT